MPRSLASGKTVLQTPDPEPQEEELPNRLTLWKEMLEHEWEEAVAEVMDTVLQRSMDGCLQVDIKQQVVPFTTNWVKECLIQTVEQSFLCNDEGDGPDDVPPEDTEPPTADPDAWAPGCVPLVTPSPPLRPITPKDVDVVQQEPEVLRKYSSSPRPKVSLKLPTKKTSPNPAVANINKLRHSFPPPKTEKKKNQFQLGAKPSKFLPPLSQSTEKKILNVEKSADSTRSSRVNCKESTSVNPNYKHKAILKLDPASLPDHCIFPKYEIVDPDMKTQRISSNRPQKKHQKQGPDRTAQSQRTDVNVRSKNKTVPSAGPLRLEAMTLAKGVTLSHFLDLNLPTAPPQTPPVKLRPIRTEPAQFKFSVDQYFVADPQVKPLSQT